jgi:hypothetical protein
MADENDKGRRFLLDQMQPIPGSETEARVKRGCYRHVEYGYEFVRDKHGNLVGNFYQREHPAA